jgi:mRNA interferase RelE/StbE
MPQYAVTFARSARKELQSLPSAVATRILDKIDILSFEPRPPGSKKLSGTGSLWRLRVGEYRVIYEIDDKNSIVDVSVVRHRKEAYR